MSRPAFLMFSFTSVFLLGLTIIGCKQETWRETREPRYLIIIREFWKGDWYPADTFKVLDVTDWEQGRDAVVLWLENGLVPYPWQGEDTIRYFFKDNHLWVNGKRVGRYYKGNEKYLKGSWHDPTFICLGKSMAWHARRTVKHFPNAVSLGIFYTSHHAPAIWPYVSLRGIRTIPRDIDLYIFYSGITNFELRQLARLPNLRWLNASSDEPCKLPRGFKNLKWLDLFAGSGSDLKNLACIKTLHVLALEGQGVNDEVMSRISRLDYLHDLTLEYTAVTDEGLAYLEDLPLRTLTIKRSPVTDAGLEHIVRISSLRHLCLEDCKVSDAAITVIQRKLPQCEVICR